MSPYGRVPIIALSYDERDKAVPKELLVDYDTGKIYVVSAYDKTVIFDLTQEISNYLLEAGVNGDNLVVNIDGVGEVNLEEIINNLYSNSGGTTKSAWAESGNLITPRTGLAGAGNSVTSLSFGGDGINGPTNSTEFYDGGIWSAGANMNVARSKLGGCGSIDSAVSFGGNDSNGIKTTVTEFYNGNVWSIGSDLNTARFGLAGCGNSNAAISFGGDNGTPLTITELYTGGTWYIGSDMNIAAAELAKCGNSSELMSFGGYDANGNVATTEKYAEGIWTIGMNLNVARLGLAGSGTPNGALAFGGMSDSVLPVTENYNATHGWSIDADLINARAYLAGSGNSNLSTLSFGGTGDSISAVTELYTKDIPTSIASLSVGITEIDKRVAKIIEENNGSNFDITEDGDSGVMIVTKADYDLNSVTLKDGNIQINDFDVASNKAIPQKVDGVVRWVDPSTIGGGGGGGEGVNDTAETVKMANTIEVKGVTQGIYKDGDVISADENVWTVLRNLLQTRIPATYVKPVVNITIGSATVEAGTTVNPIITPTFVQNDAGPLTGYILKRIDAVTTELINSTTPETYDQGPIIVTDSNLKYTAYMSYSEGPIKFDNLGNADPSGRIAAGQVSNTGTYTAFRRAFYGSETGKTASCTTSDEIRTLPIKTPGKLTTGTDCISISCAAGDTRVTIAYPATFGDIKNIKSTGLGGMSVLGVFNKTEVNVEGVDGYDAIPYKVYTYIPDAAFPGDDTYVISI